MLQIDIMILMGMVKLSQGSQKSKFVMSLQYLKKKARDKFNFLHGDKHQRFLQVGNIFLIESKDIATAFVFYCDAKHSDILRGSSQVRYNLFSGSCGQK